MMKNMEPTNRILTDLLPMKPRYMPSKPCWLFTRYNYIGDHPKSDAAYKAFQELGCGEVLEGIVLRELKALFQDAKPHERKDDSHDCIIGNRLIEIRKVCQGEDKYKKKDGTTVKKPYHDVYLGTTSANNNTRAKQLKKFYALMKGGYVLARITAGGRRMDTYWIPTKYFFNTFGEQMSIRVSKLNKAFGLTIEL